MGWGLDGWRWLLFKRRRGDAGEWAVAGGVDGVAGGDGKGDSADGGGVRFFVQLSGVVFAGAGDWVGSGVLADGGGWAG